MSTFPENLGQDFIEQLEEALKLQELADLHCDTDHYVDAERVSRKALHIKEQILGHNHPALISNVYNLGLICYQLEKYGESLSLLARTLEMEQSAHGKDHPDVLETTQMINILFANQKEVSSSMKALNLNNVSTLHSVAKIPA